MAISPRHSWTDRMKGATLLHTDTYEEVEADCTATWGELLRMLGFIPSLGGFIRSTTAIWLLIPGIVPIRRQAWMSARARRSSWRRSAGWSLSCRWRSWWPSRGIGNSPPLSPTAGVQAPCHQDPSGHGVRGCPPVPR
jgi:hypothetical protein